MTVSLMYFSFSSLKRADIAVAALTITEEREKVVDFAVPFMYFTEDMLLKKTSFNNGSIDFLKFLNPFHSDVWFVTLATLVVISVSTFVINYFSPYGYKGANGRGTSEEFSFFNSVWFALACMLQQGSESQPRSLSGTVDSRDVTRSQSKHSRCSERKFPSVLIYCSNISDNCVVACSTFFFFPYYRSHSYRVLLVLHSCLGFNIHCKSRCIFDCEKCRGSHQ